jgi:hypothetical protein
VAVEPALDDDDVPMWRGFIGTPEPAVGPPTLEFTNSKQAADLTARLDLMGRGVFFDQ